jgi:transmembrane sensor
MTDSRKRWAEAGQAIAPQYDAMEQVLFEADVRRLHKQRVLRRRVVAGAAVAMVLLTGALGTLRWSGTRGEALPQVAIAEDASVVMPRDAQVRTVQSQPGLLWLSLEHSAAHFTVAPQHGRLVRVSVGAVEVEVIGTAFTLTRSEGAVTVDVTEGRVRVRTGPRETLLSAGEKGQFSLQPLPAQAAAPEPEPQPAVAEEPAVEEPSDTAPETPAATPRPPTRPTRKAVTWRALAEKGEFSRAWTALQGEGAPRDEPGDLLAAADVARLSGHPEASLAPLQRVLAKFPQDPRASLAAFTRGRVLLDDLGNPREAAQAFLRAYALAPKSPLAPDALARAVEAQARAGDGEAARSTAERFLAAFPNSSRVEAVRRWGAVR